jgi:photosystem II stability/assembly factor-like uncharacterized protein
MALIDRNIVITPNIGQSDDPKIVFSGADANTAAQDITVRVYPTSNGTLSFEGSAGQLFSITNDLTGTLFAVNDVSGIPSIEVDADGTIRLAEFFGNVGIGTANPLVALDVAGAIRQELHTPAMLVGLNEDIGKSWTKIEMGAALEEIVSLVYCGNGIVLAGGGGNGSDGDIYRSTDFGLTWTQIEIDAGLNQIVSLAYCGNGIVIAGGGTGTGDGDIYRSTDFGLTWTKIEMGATLEQIVSLAYCGNGIVLAGSASGTGDADIYRSTDFGLTWTKIEMGAALEYIFTLIYCGNGIVLAGSGDTTGDGDIYRSTDFGLTWTQIEMGAALEFILSLAYCGNGIVIAGGGQTSDDGDIYRSTDFGLTWTQIQINAELESIRSLVYCGNGIVIAGGGNSAGDGDIYRSTDFGLTWTKIDLGAALDVIRSLAYCGNGIVIAGGGWGSSDGDIYRSDVGFSQASTIQSIYQQHLTSNVGIGTTAPTEKLDVNGAIRASTGILFGTDTAAENTLDDYEEGTWTPTLGGDATYSFQSGVYTKIGRLVIANCILMVNSIGTGATNNVSGLPFTVRSQTQSFGGVCQYFENLANAIVNISPSPNPGANTLTFYTLAAASGTTSYNTALWQNGARIDFTVMYFT